MEHAKAVACIAGGGVQGIVCFCQQRHGVLVTAQVTGLPQEGFFALHIHEGTDCRGVGFPNTGSHYNPAESAHPNHAGDLPPMISCGGSAYLSVLTDRFRLEQVMGRTLVIHSNRDDFTTQPSGDAGTKIACGVIRPHCL